MELEFINHSVDELETGRLNHPVKVILSETSAQTVSVKYRTQDVTADPDGIDFIDASGTLYFAPGVSERTFTVLVLSDNKVEDTERFFIHLHDPVNAILDTRRGAGCQWRRQSGPRGGTLRRPLDPLPLPRRYQPTPRPSRVYMPRYTAPPESLLR